MTTRRPITGHRAAALMSICGLLVGVAAMPLEAFAEPKRPTMDDALATAKRAYPGLLARRSEKTAAEEPVGEAISGYLRRADSSVQYLRTTGNWLPTPGMAGLVRGTTSDRELRLGFDDSSARFQSIQARYDLAVARVLLRRAVGV